MPVFALQAAHDGLAAHLLQEDRPATFDDPRQSAVEVLATGVDRLPGEAAWLRACKTHVDQPALRQEELRFAAEKQHARDGGLPVRLLRADAHQQLVHRLAQVAAEARRTPVEKILDDLIVQVGRPAPATVSCSKSPVALVAARKLILAPSSTSLP